MRKLSLVFPVIFLLSQLSCKKDPVVEPAPVTSDTTQTFLEQDIYTIGINNSPNKGTVLVAPFTFAGTPGKGSLMIFNEKGQLLKKKETQGTALCFRKWEINGEVRYSYLENDAAIFHLPNLGALTGPAVILDESLNEIKRVHLISHNDIIAAGNKPDLDLHDFILLSDNHYYTCAYYPKKVTNIPDTINSSPSVTIIACVIQEVKDDKVVWQWDSSEYPEFYGASLEGNVYTNAPIPQDYIHMNSMVIDPKDNNLIVSFRQTDQVVKINTVTGDIIWRLGGKTSDFHMAPHHYFYRQHNATLVDDNQTLLLFDNGHITHRPLSRIVEFKLNENSKTITSFKSFDIPEPFAQFMGSVQKIGSSYFIGGGSIGYVLEINSLTGEKTFEMTSPMATYRAYKYE